MDIVDRLLGADQESYGKELDNSGDVGADCYIDDSGRLYIFDKIDDENLEWISASASGSYRLEYMI